MQEARATLAAVRAERCRPLERGKRDRQRAALHRPFGCGVEERGDRLVRRVGRSRAMPGRTIGIAHDTREGEVRLALVLDGRPLLDRRTDQGMAEAKRGAVDLDESRIDRRCDRRCRYAGSSHDLRDPVAILERSDQQQPLRVMRQVIRTRRELALEARAERKDVGEPLPWSDVIADRRRQLGQREGVSGSLLEDPIPHRRGESGGDPRHHLSRVAIAQRVQGELRDACRIERRCLPIAGAHQHHERIRAEAASDEGESIGGRAVEPLDVVGDHQDRGAGGGIREQCERGQGDEERVLGFSLDEPECHTERRVLRLRQRIEPAEDRSEKLVEAGERQIGLGADAGRQEDSHPGVLRQLDGPLQQRRLADPRLTVDQECPAAGGRCGHEAADDPELAVPPDDPLASDHPSIFARDATSSRPPPGPPEGSSR